MADQAPTGFRFLYRTEQGRIDRAGWISAALPLIAVALAATILLIIALPYANRDLSERKFYDPAAFAANVTIIVYAFGLFLLAVSWVNLASKRFRDRGRPAPLGLAGLLPLVAFLVGAAHWLQPRVAEVMPRWSVWACDAVLIVVALWTIAELCDAIPTGRRVP